MKKNKKLVVIIILVIIFAVIISIMIASKKEETKIEYNIAEINSYEYLKYSESGKIGVIDKAGNVIINAEYQEIVIPNPEKDIFICTSYGEEKNKVLNSKGEEQLKKYDNIEPIKLKNIASVLCYEKSVLKYEKDGKYGLINFNGKELTQNNYSSIENLQATEGKFLVKNEEKYGIINISGTELVKCNFDKISTDGYLSNENGYIKAGFIVAQKQDDGYKYGYIDYTGKEILGTKFNKIIRIENEAELYLIVYENGQYGLYKNSKVLIKTEYQEVNIADNGAVILQKNKKYGIANLKGEVLVEPKYESIEAEGIYLYAKSQESNIVYDVNANIIDINFNKKVYETENKNYRITTLENNDEIYYGIENIDGTTLINAGYKYIEYAYGEYFIAVDENDKYGVINANEKNTLEFKYDDIQVVKEKNMLQALNSKDNITEIFSSNLDLSCTVQDANIKINEEYIVISNKERVVYLDNNGNEIEENSSIIENNKKKSIPETVGEYKKEQYSLENIYYVKK